MLQAGARLPGELTAINMDKSDLLDSLIQRKHRGQSDALLGELQVLPLPVLLSLDPANLQPYSYNLW